MVRFAEGSRFCMILESLIVVKQRSSVEHRPYYYLMNAKPKPFKSSPRRYWPKGTIILYEDHDILVVDKAAGLLSMGNEQEREKTAYYMLTDYIRKGNPKARKRLFIVHRLDRDTSGVLVFAKSEQAKRYLQDEWPKFKKNYLAVVHGIPPKKSGVLTSYLAENKQHEVYSVDDPKKGKLAKTGYRVAESSSRFSLMELELQTGRKNQIRVQLADGGCPVVGDRRYGIKSKGINRLGLHALSLTLTHPHSRNEMTFTADIPPVFSEWMAR